MDILLVQHLGPDPGIRTRLPKAGAIGAMPHALKRIERQKGRNSVKTEHIKEDRRQLRRKSLDELISGNEAKYKQPLGISWLNIHRLFDFRRWRFFRFKLFLLVRGIKASGRRTLSLTGRHNRTGASGSGV